MPWQKNYDETEVLENAMHAFWRHGYEATSMRDLVEATGINRGSMYAAFPSKRDLFMRALAHYDRRYRGDHLREIARGRAPLDAIVEVFRLAAQPPASDEWPRGCLIVNTALEMSPHDAEIGEFVNRSLRAVEDFFHAQIEAARRDGSLRRSLDSRETAQALLGLFLGLRVLARAGSGMDAAAAITAQARAMLE